LKKGFLLFLFILGCAGLHAQGQRMVFFEEFSQASCPACATSNPHLDSLLLQNPTKALFIKYETSWPGVDPMNAQNPAENASRVSFYGISGDPDIFMDGIDYSDPSNVTQAVIDNEYGVPSPFTLQLSWWKSPGNDSLYASCNITCVQNISLTKPVLQIAMLEKTISFTTAPGSNGETVFYHIMRKLFPDANGTSLPATWTTGQTITVSYKEKIPSYIYTASEMALTAWIQDGANRSIKQAVYSASASAPSAASPVAYFAADDTASCNGLIHFQDQSALFPSYWLWDFGDANTSSLQNPVHQYTQSGIYTVRLKAGNANGSNVTTKTSLIHISFAGAAPQVINDERCGQGTVALSATATSGGTLNWYDTTGALVHTGPNYAPFVSGTSHYYVSEVMPFPVSISGANDTMVGPGGFYTANTIHGLYFDVLESSTLLSVQCYAHSPGNRTIVVMDAAKHGFDSVVVNLNAGLNTVNLNFPLPAANGYFIKLGTGSMVDLYRNTANAVYPYSGTEINITGNDASASAYFYFYNWQVQKFPCLSESAVVTGADTCLAAGIAEQRLHFSLNVFPNPATGIFSIRLNTTKADRSTLQLINASGQIIYTETCIPATGSFLKTMDLTSYPRGLYLLTLSGNGYRESQRLILN